MTAHHTITAAPVRKQVRVKLGPDAAFDLFATRMDAWWPRDKTVNPETQLALVVLEPFAGGRWFERGVNGAECEWGRVLVWEPGRRLVLDWQLSANYAYDPELHTEVEVTFTAESGGTVVDLEHRNIENFGPRHAEMRAGIDSEGGWTGIMADFAAKANA